MGMTVDDLKEQYSMRDVVERYGLHVDRAGFVNCPFHAGDRTASLKVYKDSFYCFGCAEHGDIINFVMKMDNCDFKTAYKSLGGTTGRMSDAAVLRMKKRKREAERYKQRLSDALRRLQLASSELRYWEDHERHTEPYSEVWCDIQNLLPKVRFFADEALINYLNVIDEGR